MFVQVFLLHFFTIFIIGGYKDGKLRDQVYL